MDGIVYIIVPVYNDEKYLERCFNSLFNQTYGHIIIVAVNDGSIDKSLELLNSFANAHDNIVVINKDNGGLSSARNAGLRTIKNLENVFLMFVDADDYLENDYVETMIDIMELDKTDIVCSDHYWFDSETTKSKTFDTSIHKSIKLDRNEAIIRLFNGEIHSHIPTKLYKGSLWLNRFFDESVRFMEDQRITFKIFNDANSLSYTTYQGYNYYSNPKSLVRSTFNNRKVLEGLDGYFEAIKFYDNDRNSLLLKYAKTAFASAFLMLYPRFNYKEATENEIERFEYYLEFVKKYKIVQYANFVSKNDRKKRIIYLTSKHLYAFLYRNYISRGNQ